MKKLPSPAIIVRGLLILILLVFLLSAACIFLRRDSDASDPAAEIYQNGKLLQTIRLRDVTAPYTFTVTGDNGAYNEIQVTPEGIEVISASCPDKICVHQGRIHTDLLPITCLPNHLVIRVTKDPSGNGSQEPDALTY